MGFFLFMERKKDGCGVQYGQKWIILLKDGDFLYVVIVVKCKFGDFVGLNGYGGYFFMNLLVGEYIFFLSEFLEFIDKIQFEGFLDCCFVVCIFFIWGKFNVDYFKEWLVYYYYFFGLECIYYFFYVGVVFDELMCCVL